MTWTLEWLLLVVAIGVGWLLGRYLPRSRAAGEGELVEQVVGPERGVSRRHARMAYPKSFQYLFDAYESPTLDSFIQDLAINPDTVHLHLSIANYYRRKGEIEKSTAIHQNLLGSPAIEDATIDRLNFELAQDYMVAGLYDRAESLFIDLAANKDWRERSIESLLEIYEHEKDWDIARGKALSLDLKKNSQLQVRVAHYCCEMAERSIRRQDYDEANTLLKDALSFDRLSVRASLLLARVCVLQGQSSEALTELKRIETQNPEFLTEALPLIAEICEQADQPGNQITLLRRIWSLQPNSQTMVALALTLAEQGKRREAIEFMLRQLDEHPTLRGVRTLMELLLPLADSEPQRWIHIIRGVLDSMLEKNHSYRCAHCGFDGRHLHWQCPRCKRWSSMHPVAWV